MRILVIGSGGREHALAWKISQSEKVDKVYVAPGNAGMEDVATLVPISSDDTDELLAFAKREKMDLTVVGPEVPLLNGIVDVFKEAGLAIFGPNTKAAYIEGSKRYAKDLMKRYSIPTADYEVFTESKPAIAYVRSKGVPIVVKADGLAAGKGVVVAHSMEEAEAAIIEALEKESFGHAGKLLVIEEFLSGEEMSLMAFVDGNTIIPMVPAQDHKQVFDQDQGPNTGGMGAYSPVPQYPSSIIETANKTILTPMLQAFQAEGIEYRGVLYAGLMITEEGPKVIEFNARFGDPETQVVLPRLQTDLVDILLAVVEGRLQELEVKWSNDAAVCVVLTAGGYPNQYEKGKEITGLKHINQDGQWVFHAGTKRLGNQMVTHGGRVLGVTAMGENLEQAQHTAYEMTKEIHFEGVHYRRDIADKAIGTSKKKQG